MGRKHFSDTHPIQNGLKKGDALHSHSFCNCALEYAIRRSK